MALIFKCLTDNIMLDDFKTELQKLGGKTMERDVGQHPSPLPKPPSGSFELASPPRAFRK